MTRHSNSIGPMTDTTFHEAGMTPAAVRRGESQAKFAEIRKKREYNRLTKAPRIVHPDREAPIPEAILQATIAKIEIQLRIGNLEAAHEHIDGFGQAIAGDPPPATYDDFLALAVGDLGFPQRTLNLIDQIGLETIGELLAGFPERFRGVANCGGVTIEAIAETLTEWGGLTKEDAAVRVTQWKGGPIKPNPAGLVAP